MKLFSASKTPPSAGFLACSAVFIACGHLGVWAVVAWASGKTFADIMGNWDSGHFSLIATEGYAAERWAFYPLYPMLLKVATTALNWIASAPPQIAGTFVSCIFFATFVWSLATGVWTKTTVGHKGPPAHALRPTTHVGWLLFLMSPASYVFQSNHTESLYLLLTFSAFSAAFQPRRWVLAAFLSGLAALTRNHGVLAAIAVALIAAGQVETKQQKILRFTLSGTISAALFAIFPLYQQLKIGDPLAFVHAHTHWNLPSGPLAYFATLWFGNPMQNLRPMSILRHGFFFVLIWSCWLWWRRSRPIAIYLAMYVLLLPAQLEFVDAFRFGAVLWPVFFLIGDMAAERLGRNLNVLLLTGTAILNVAMTIAYGMGRWAY